MPLDEVVKQFVIEVKRRGKRQSIGTVVGKNGKPFGTATRTEVKDVAKQIGKGNPEMRAVVSKKRVRLF